MPKTVGIDLGTTNSVIAVMEGGDDRVGRPQVDSYGLWHCLRVLQVG